MARVLVTGGAGFIGSTIAAALVRKGEDVAVLDNFSLGRAYELSDVRRDVTVLRGDIRKPSDVRKAFSGVEQVYHLASASSAPMYEPDPRKATLATVNGFLNVLEEARARGVGSIVYASSSSLYAATPPPHREDARVSPVSFYTAAKLAKEHYAAVYSRAYGMRIAAMRFFSVYGPRERHKERYANVVTQFLWKMRRGERPVIFGDGSQTRDYIYSEDVARCCLLAMGKKADGVFNVGTGKAHSFNETVGVLNRVLVTRIAAAHVKNPIGNYVAHTLADTRKSRETLGFTAAYSFEQGVRECAREYAAGRKTA